jgi:hypothetical protein
VDQKLRNKLAAAGVFAGEVEVGDAAGWLARQVKAADAIDVHHRLQSWSDKGGSARAASNRPNRKTARKSTGSSVARSSKRPGDPSRRRKSSSVA